MQKFIEELDCGDVFEFENKKFIITSDFKKSGDKLCIDINTGNTRWIKPDCHINHIYLYVIDQDNNFSPIKEIKKDDISTKT